MAKEKHELEFDKSNGMWCCKFCYCHSFMLCALANDPRQLVVVCMKCEAQTELTLDG